MQNDKNSPQICRDKSTYTSISQNLKSLRSRIAVAAEKSGRTLDDITLVAVTKTVTVEKINEAIKLGITDIGENRVQEFLSKEAELLPANRHLIGHLQRNKVRQIVGKVCLIHSVDSVPLLREIDSQAAKIGIKQDILMQINVSGEESKFGMPFELCGAFIAETETLENVHLRGMMTIPPLTSDSELLKDIFLRTREIFEGTGKPFDVLSMGMSGDFELAIECGSNMVRIGSGIFGARS
ncbi:MAG: YggS family pyridoxal phosphate-dependent enzyme [Oscillospiraceae bacterium]|nr:YggS family pyridoxal phosphate-dependent enzyme [Oscillospiraceae bacterium]